MDKFLLNIFKTPEDVKLWRNAIDSARFEVDGFISHDRQDYRRTAEDFYESLVRMLPWFPRGVLHKIANEKTEVLRNHDYIEDSDESRSKKLRDPRWNTKVMPHAKREARLLGIDLAYAREKTDFYKFHGQGEDEFRDHVYNMDKYFTEGLTGEPKLYHVTAPIYLTCVGLHDMRRVLGKEEHDKLSRNFMQVQYADYVILLQLALPDYRGKVLAKLSTIK